MKTVIKGWITKDTRGVVELFKTKPKEIEGHFHVGNEDIFCHQDLFELDTYFKELKLKHGDCKKVKITFEY